MVLWVCYSKVRCGTVGVCSLTNKNDSRSVHGLGETCFI